MPLREDGTVARSFPATFKNAPPWRRLKMARYERQVAEVLDLSAHFRDAEDAALQERAAACREAAGNGKPLDRMMVEFFALAREAGRRVLWMEHYPVQILGGIGLHTGHIVEMATGEGKTLCATLPAALNAIGELGVHVVTVNDYLAERDAHEMKPLYAFLGLTTAHVVHDSEVPDRRKAYRADITYATNKELGFDFLRDQLADKGQPWFQPGRKIADLAGNQRLRPVLNYAIVDEADSILIDEARTPLIIADAPPDDPEIAHEYGLADRLVRTLKEGEHFSYERKEKRIEWLRPGEDRVTRELGHRRSLSGHRIDWHEAALRALKAHLLFRKDIEYVCEDDEVVIVDEFTGRKMPGRQWEEGLHQAVTCKEGLPIKARAETLARTTYQVFFNLYRKLSGMTGTVMTDAREIAEVFGIGALPIPTHRKRLRELGPDLVFATEERKWDALAQAIAGYAKAGRPVLVGTRSIDKSETIAAKLEAAGIPHTVLNARHEKQEAEIVKDAGHPGRVTVATNMAGRGTDIKLAPGVSAAGGLVVLGTERHESRRVDNQMIGRCARQGDRGYAQFFLSLEDPLAKRYRPKQAARLAAKHGKTLGPIADADVQRFFRRLQKGIEAQHRKTRRDLLKHERERTKFNRQIGLE